MADIAKHVRIFTKNPTDEFVNKRITAINGIETAIKKKVSVKDILDFAGGLIIGLENAEQTNEQITGVSVASLKKSSTSFVADEEALQLLTCTTIATLQYLEKAKKFEQKPSPEFILAIALWNGLSFQTPIKGKDKLELLRKELLETAAKIANEMAVKGRDRKETKLRVPVTPSANTWEAFVASAEISYGKSLDALRINAYLDREEIDVLWWALGNWSETCQVQISKLNSVQSCIVSSVEIGSLLRRFPARSHSFLACRNVDQNEEYTAAEVTEKLGDLLKNISECLIDSGSNQKIFPVSSILKNSDQLPVNDIKRKINEWAARLLVEISLHNINKFVE